MTKGKYKDSGIQNSLTMWHGAKRLAKKIHPDLWRGVIHHVTPGSHRHQALTDIVLNTRWLKDLQKYLNFRSTVLLEPYSDRWVNLETMPELQKPPTAQQPCEKPSCHRCRWWLTTPPPGKSLGHKKPTLSLTETSASPPRCCLHLPDP
ncbi:hypothetical protein J4Q44_G00192310 [Coregonus suidteri]|uniref:Uncharacterized protein n=1 Tax=Coregonus suidteri TaxID=861788 RepID=A0AAN8M226_9TELE